MRFISNHQGVFLYIFALVIFAGVGSLQFGPGYMDADYYYVNAKAIAAGDLEGEPFFWNYISEQQELPGVSFLYWMPLTSLLTAAGAWVTGNASFFGARLGLFFTAALISPLSAQICKQIGGSSNQALLAGLIALFPGFYLPFLSTTDAFAIYMVVGGVYLILIQRGLDDTNKLFVWVGVGFSAGLMHLCRADGIFWFIIALLAIWGNFKSFSHRSLLLASIYVFSGYLVVVGPWFWRNWQEFSSIIPPGTSKTLWLTNYDEFYSYPSTSITFQSWLDSGWPAIIRARVWALFQNFQTMLAVQGLIFLFPLILIGLYRTRKNHLVRIGSLLWLLLFGLMSFIWPFPGARGSFYHSAAGVQTLLWATVPFGFQTLIEFAERRRGWDSITATKFFSISIVFLAFILSVFLTSTSLNLGTSGSWGSEVNRYAEIESFLMTIDPQRKAIVMVNNPPGFTLAAQRPSIVIPSGEIASVFEAAEQFGAEYLILEPDTNFPEIYADPSTLIGLDYLATIDKGHVFKIIPQP